MLLLLEAAAAAAAACVAATLWPVLWGGGTAGAGAAFPPTATAAVAACVLQSVAVALLLGVRGARRLSARAPPRLRCWALELSPSLPPAGAPAAPAGPAGGRTGAQLPPTAGEAKPLRRVGGGDDDDPAELPVPASVGRRQYYPQRAADSPARACDPLPSPSAASPLLPPLDAPPYTSNYTPAASPEAPATPPPFLKRRARSQSSDDGTAAEEEDEGEVQELQVDALLADMCSEEHSVLHEACAAFRAAMQPGEAGLVADLCGQGT